MRTNVRSRPSRLMPLAALVAAWPFAVLGCDGGSAPPATAAHDHDHGGNDHAKGGHGSAMGHDHGEPHPLGERTAGAMTVEAILEGDLVAGAEASFVINVSGGTPKAVRFWIGRPDERGALKVKAELEAGEPGYHAHSEVPSPLAADAQLVVELETDSGRETVTFDLPPAKG